MKISAYAANEPKGAFEAITYDGPELRADDVLVVSYHPSRSNFKMSEINDAFEHFESGKARYRIVLVQDL